MSIWTQYQAARRSVVRAIGERGRRAVEALQPSAGLGEQDEVGKAHRRAGVTIKAARAAARAYHAAHHSTWPDERRAYRLGLAEAELKACGGVEAHPQIVVTRAFRRHGGRPARHVVTRSGRSMRSTETLRRLLRGDREEAISREIDQAYRHGSSSVRWVDSPEACGVRVDYSSDWQGYSARCSYPMRTWSVEVCAVEATTADLPGRRRDLDGLLTLAAVGVPSPGDGVRAWDAVWLERSRGVSWTTRRGAIVEGAGGEVAHGADVATALRTLRARATRRQTLALARRGIDRGEALKRHGCVRLSWRVARRAGLCASGIRGWVARHFPDRDPERDTVTVAEALGVRESEGLVLAAVAVAVAASRREGRET